MFLPITITFDFLELNFRFHLLANLAVIFRISFGDSLWTSIIRPSIAHGCAVWFSSAISSAQNIESLQYQAGKVILKERHNSLNKKKDILYILYCYIFCNFIQSCQNRKINLVNE
jgi:hypothetical protein